jgi:Copper transport outer membrane protein, MctB
VINFRYHVVSIVAVFLALAIGIVLGSTELHGTVLDRLDSLSTNLKNDLTNAHAANSALQHQVNVGEAYATASAPRVIGGLLAGQKVVLVVAPGAPGNVVSGVSAALKLADATVTGQVSLQPLVFDPSASNQSFLSTLVSTLASTPARPPNGSPLAQASWLLGSAILTKNDPSPGTQSGSQSGKSSGTSGTSGTSGASVLSGYAQAGLLNVTSGQPGADPATLAVVVTPSAAPADGDSDSTDQGLVTLATELNTAGLGTVVVGSTSGSVAGSAINALRASSAATQISTVDNADTEIGQITTVQALADALGSQKAGSYGVDGAGAAVPTPAPTPAASTTPATTAHSQGDTRKHGSGSKTSEKKS